MSYCVGWHRLRVGADVAPCSAGTGLGQFSRRLGVLLLAGWLLVVRLCSAVAAVDYEDWQRLMVGGGSLLVLIGLGTRRKNIEHSSIVFLL